MHLNHRDIARSRSYPQLRNQVDGTNYTKCGGALLVEEIFDLNPAKYINPWQHYLNPQSIANPCGLIAKAYFKGITSII